MRILVIEDNDMVGTFVVKGFREQGYAVDQAIRGDEGWALITTGDYDLIILDLMLPGLGGLELLKRLRGQGYSMPVLILTAKDRIESRVEGLNLGADDYLTKPFAFAELLARVQALLRRCRTSELEVAESLGIGKLVINPLSRQVSCSGVDVQLTAKEYSLLDFLLRNKGRVLTRTTIIEHVWDRHFDSDTNLVDVYIQRLRKKLEEHGCHRYITTRRGMGYVIKDDQ